jgi:hypothetical protein
MLQWSLSNPSGILGEVFIAMLAIRWFRVPADRRRTEFIFLAAVAVYPVSVLIQNFLEFLGRAVPVKYDFYVDRFDAQFGQPSFFLGQFFVAHHLALWGTFVYNLPFIITVGLVALYLWTGRNPAVVIRVSVLLWALLVPLYLVFPVSGPKYAFASFPYVHASYIPHAAIIPGAPNGVPSGHMAFALITLYLVRHWKGLIFPGTLYVLATALTALGTGEHYLFDLVLAVPFSALLVWISESPQTARKALAQQPAKAAWSGSLAAWESTESEGK